MGDETLYDCTIYCGGGGRVHANTFVLTQNCKLLATAYDCERERRDFHLHDMRTEDMQLVVDIIHKKTRLSSLDIDAVERLMKAFDYLDCKFRYKRIIDRLWALCRALTDVDTLYRHADVFAHSEEHRLDFLLKLRLLTTTWPLFRRVFQHIRMNQKFAVFCMQHLMLYFPAVLVYIDLVNSCPVTFQYEIGATLLGLYRIGVYFHPKEYAMALKKLIDVAPFKGIPIIRNCIESNQMYESSSSKLHATFLSYTNSPKASVLIEMVDPLRGQRRIKVAGVADLWVNTVDGTLTGTLWMHRLAGHVQFATNTVYVRTVTYVSTKESEYDVIDCDISASESWKVFEDIDHAPRGEINLATPDTIPYPACDVEEAMKDPRLRCIRVDVFWHRDPRSSLHF